MSLPLVSDQHIDEVCKPGTPACCMFLGAAGKGMVCLKNDPELSALIRGRHAAGQMMATGDNCEGLNGG